MNGRISIWIAVAVCLSWGWIGMVGNAEAAIFTDIKSRDGWEIEDGDQYTHTPIFSPPGTDINSASLTLEYGGISTCEVWLVQSGNAISIGILPPFSSNDSDNTTEHIFNLDHVINEIIGNNPWSLTVFFDYVEDSSRGNEWMKLYESTLSGEYTAVPIPGTALLLFSGLAGLVCFKQTRKK